MHRFVGAARRVGLHHDLGGFAWVFHSVVPALEAGFEELGHARHKGRVFQVGLEHVQAVFQRRHAFFFIEEGDQVALFDARVHHLPVFVVNHGGNTGGLVLQQRVYVKALLEDLDVGVRLVAELGHPVQEGVFVAAVPDAQGLAVEVFGAVDAAGLFAGEHQGRLVEHLGDIDQEHTGFARGQGVGHPVHRRVSGFARNQLHGRNVGATGLDGHVQTCFLVVALGLRHVVASELGLRQPLELHGHFFLGAGGKAGHGQQACQQCLG